MSGWWKRRAPPPAPKPGATAEVGGLEAAIATSRSSSTSNLNGPTGEVDLAYLAEAQGLELTGTSAALQTNPVFGHVGRTGGP